MSAPHLHINHLRLQAPNGRPVALKLGVQQALRQLHLRPANLPPGAILVIRQLHCQPPAGLQTAHLQRWQQQVQREIDSLAQQARHPGWQYIPPTAASVVFIDDVDLLTCYTRDLLAQRSAWYWINLCPVVAYPGQAQGHALLTAWEAYPQAIPQTVVALKPPEAQAALKLLDRSELSRLARLLHECFALPDDVFAAAAPETATTSEKPPHVVNDSQLLSTQSATLLTGRAAPPWREWLPASLQKQLPPPAEYLLGLCYGLVRQPQQVRHKQFAAEARRWLEQPASYNSHPTEQPAASAGDGPSTIDVSPTAGAPSPSEADPSEASNNSTDRPAATGTFTRLGGVIYLINLLNRLHLSTAISAFERLNPWELLAGLAAVLLDDDFDHYHADPLWPILTELAGLSAEKRWGESVVQADSFMLPPEWLSLLRLEVVNGRLETAAGRSRLWSTGHNILLADVPDAPAQLERFLSRYEEAGILVNIERTTQWTKIQRPPNDFLAPSLGWQLTRLRPFVASLLQQLTDTPIHNILHQPAMLYTGRTHIDLHLSLAQISIPLRRAGLDRTPGWLPDYGYILTIHFE